MSEPVWVFGYGSLIYKADFPFLERVPAHLHGWARRFWQGSHDHRGTPQAPGRVVTLIAEPGAVCGGVAYFVTPDVFAHLDHREKNGYRRVTTEFHFADGRRDVGLVYIADADNEAYLGPQDEADIARHIAGAHGPSGSNREYLIRLASSLRQMGETDAHVFAIEAHLLALDDAAR